MIDVTGRVEDRRVVEDLHLEQSFRDIFFSNSKGLQHAYKMTRITPKPLPPPLAMSNASNAPAEATPSPIPAGQKPAPPEDKTEDKAGDKTEDKTTEQ